MKFGKIYTYENRDEAMKLVGKKVIASDSLVRVHNPTTSVLMLVDIDFCDADYPFCCKLNALDCSFHFQFIREVIEEEKEKPKLMTNRQLSEWCIKCGMARHKEIVFGRWDYRIEDEDDCVEDDALIRPWDSDEWVKPTVEIYERDCKGIRTIE